MISSRPYPGRKPPRDPMARLIGTNGGEPVTGDVHIAGAIHTHSIRRRTLVRLEFKTINRLERARPHARALADVAIAARCLPGVIHGTSSEPDHIKVAGSIRRDRICLGGITRIITEVIDHAPWCGA